MPLILGLDTGGTFTDAALLDAENRQVVAHAKSLTTRHDLSVGVGAAMAEALAVFGGNSADIRLVSLSTTLATNAVVESVGGASCLILIGFDNNILSRAGLQEALGAEPYFAIAGGHKPDGRPQTSLDVAGLMKAMEAVRGRVSSFAVASHFATRNPEHERQARDILREQTGLPVSCSFELSSALGGPRRALTTLLNARLISLLDRLVRATEAQMAHLGLDCPLMVVKGDGSLLHVDYARTRPVETILSGPAASLAGAAFLADKKQALVADIGGTTTDIARLQDGAALLSHEGAHIGGWRTMVEAAHIRTRGLGGDSEIRADNRAMQPELLLGPRRAIPLSLLAQDYPEIKDQLKKQLDQPIAQPHDARFVLALMPEGVPEWLSRSEARLAEQVMAGKPVALAELATTQVALGAVDRLVRRGLLIFSCFTPTDAAHITGQFTRFDGEAAALGAQLLARQKTAAGQVLATDIHTISQMSLDTLTLQSAISLLDAGFAEQGEAENTVSSSAFLVNSLRQAQIALHSQRSSKTRPATGRQIAEAGLGLKLPLIALGASAAAYYPDIARLVGAELIVPPFSEVAGAVGAAAGSVRQRVMILVTQPKDGVFRIHLPDGLKDRANLQEALDIARQAATEMAMRRATEAGAKAIETSLSEAIDEIDLGADKSLFLQATLTAEASGIPA